MTTDDSPGPPPPRPPYAAPPRPPFGPLVSPAVLKVLLIAGLILALLIPLFMVEGVIRERQYRSQQVVEEIGNLWGRAQLVAGPILAIPYIAPPPEGDRDGEPSEETAFVLPDDYRITAEVVPETRRRGIFEAVVYTVDLTIEGRFLRPSDDVFGTRRGAVAWDQARLLVGVSDQRSIREGVSIDWQGGAVALEPGLDPELSRLVTGGMQGRLPSLADTAPGTELAFSLRLRLAGSTSLSFMPLGRQNHLAVTSPWPSPSFEGAHLPEEYETGPDGFTAAWSVSYFGRSYPQSWTTAQDDGLQAAQMAGSAYGVRFVQPANAYQQTERSAKYGLLFLVLTFGTLFLFEVASGRRIHIFQYGLVGLALCLFFLLLLSLAEVLGFGLAYLIAAVAVVGQILLYAGPILRWGWRLAVLGLLLAGLYAALYVLMQMEDRALLVGALGLFAALCTVMYVTRNIDWYALQRRGSEPAGG